MTLQRLQGLVLTLGNQTFVRHYLWLNYPQEPQLMGIQFAYNAKEGPITKGRTWDRAQNLVDEAIKRGLIVRKTECQECGVSLTFKDGRSGIQTHHCDYNKPLDVMWLCQKCHHNWHKHNVPVELSSELPELSKILGVV